MRREGGYIDRLRGENPNTSLCLDKYASNLHSGTTGQPHRFKRLDPDLLNCELPLETQQGGDCPADSRDTPHTQFKRNTDILQGQIIHLCGAVEGVYSTDS